MGRAEADSRIVAGVPGRTVVLAALGTLLLATLALAATFALWRAELSRNVTIGKATIPPALDPLADRVPTGVDADDWTAAIEATRAMLAEVVGTGQLDADELAALRDDLDRRVAAATPESAVETLRRIWDDMERLKGRFRARLARARPSLLDAPR